MRIGSEVFHTLKKQLSKDGHNTNVGDEGGFAPNLKSADEALGFIMTSIEKAGYKPGEDVCLALDCAATEYFNDGFQLKYKAQVGGGNPVKHELIRAVDPSGVTHTYTYGSAPEAGLLKTIEVPGGKKVSFNYEPSSGTISRR